MRQIYQVEIEPPKKRKDLLIRYALPGRTRFSYSQLNRWEQVMGILPPPRNAEYSIEQVWQLDQVWLLIRVFDRDIKCLEEEIINSGLGLEKWVERNWSMSLEDYLRLKPENIRQHPVVISVLNRFEKQRRQEEEAKRATAVAA